MLVSLKWPTLAQRRKIARLKLFYKIMYNSSVLIIPPYYRYTRRNTRSHHHLHLIQRQANTMAYQQSFFPRTIKDWNHLPINVIEIQNFDTFQTQLFNFYSQLGNL